MEEEKLWWIVEFALRDLDLSHPLLISLLLSLPFPVKAKPPPHIRRLFLIRHLLSVSASHRLLSPLTLQTLERLLPYPPFPPSPSLCTAYATHLFYLSTSPGSSVEVSTVLSRLSNYPFAMKLLEPWRGMIARQEKIRSCAVDRVVSARDKAIFSLRDFVDEEFRTMEPPFLTRSVQQACSENQKNASPAPSKKYDAGNQKETEAVQRETLPTTTGAKQIDGTCTPSKKSDKGVTQNRTRENERETLPTKTDAKQGDSTWTSSKRSDKGATWKETRANQTEICPTKTGAIQADGTCTNASTGTSTSAIASAQQNHTCEENQLSSTKSHAMHHETRRDRSNESDKETLRNANDASTLHANSTNNHVNHMPKNRFMDRNPTAHVFEWNDSIDDTTKTEKTGTGMPSRKTRQLEGQNGRISKRRQILKWEPHEEEALRKAVKEIGKGNWKEIVDSYPNEFVGRTAIDLKDKWRNMTRY